MNPASPGSCAERVKPASVDPPSRSSDRGSNYTNTGQSNLFHTATGLHHNSSHGTEHTHILLLHSLIISFTISSSTYWDSFKTETIYRWWCHGYHTVFWTLEYILLLLIAKSRLSPVYYYLDYREATMNMIQETISRKALLLSINLEKSMKCRLIDGIH